MPETDALLRIAYAAAETGDFAHARKCYDRGASLNDAMCIHALGYMHDVGEGGPEDKATAMKFYRRAWRLGSHASASNIAIIYRAQGKNRTMFSWWQRVALAGDGSAKLELAKCYLKGVGVRKNKQEALQWLTAAEASSYIAEFEREEEQALLAELKPHSVE